MIFIRLFKRKRDSALFFNRSDDLLFCYSLYKNVLASVHWAVTYVSYCYGNSLTNVTDMKPPVFFKTSHFIFLQKAHCARVPEFSPAGRMESQTVNITEVDETSTCITEIIKSVLNGMENEKK